MKTKERASLEPSHTPKFLWVACIVLLVVLLFIGLAKLLALTKIFVFH